MFHRHNQSRQ